MLNKTILDYLWGFLDNRQQKRNERIKKKQSFATKLQYDSRTPDHKQLPPQCVECRRGRAEVGQSHHRPDSNAAGPGKAAHNILGQDTGVSMSARDTCTKQLAAMGWMTTLMM